MSERIIKWGFIGCGEVTKYKSGPAFQKIENSEVVAVMSRNGDKAKTYAKERRRSGNVHGVHLFVVNQLLGIVVPFRNPSFLGVGLGLVTISAHDGHYFGVLYFLECRSAFEEE